MKLYAGIILLLSTHTFFGVWTVAAVVNTSDINLHTGVRMNRKQQEVVVQSVTNTLQDKKTAKRIKLGKKSSFGSSGSCKIKGTTKEGKDVTFAFKGDPVNRVANGRADARSDLTDLTKSLSRSAATPMKSSKMARVILHTQDGYDELIAHAGYEKDNQKFVLHVSGSSGVYAGSLKKTT